MARIRAAPEDFRVDEIPLYAPCGEGAHTFVRVEKRGVTTETVARALARAAGVRSSEVGYAGRKDRWALTTQWLSVPGLDPARALALALPDARVVEAARHRHKLRTGQLRGNRFAIAVRELDDVRATAAAARLEELSRVGMPNRFGTQRFGRGGANPERAGRLLRGEERVADRRRARFLVSALQAAVFNDVLDARPRPAGELERGDVAVVHASGGLFRVEDPGREQPRADAFEISPTGPIFGRRLLQGLAPAGGERSPAPGGAVADREARAVAARGLVGLDPPRGIRLRGGRRALRVRPEGARARRLCDGGAPGLLLEFELPAGSYATVLLREVLGAEPREGEARASRDRP